MQNEKGDALSGKKLVLGVCSSIAAYKAADLTSVLVKMGADVRVVMTRNAARIVSPRVFQTLSRNDVNISMWGKIPEWKPEHISLAEFADLMVVAPATANTIGNFANGLAPDLLSSVFLAVPPCNVVVAPAMNSAMYAHPSVKRNTDFLKEVGVSFVEPGYGALACGTEGRGRLAGVDDIVSAVVKKLTRKIPS